MRQTLESLSVETQTLPVPAATPVGAGPTATEPVTRLLAGSTRSSLPRGAPGPPLCRTENARTETAAIAIAALTTATRSRV